MKLLPGLALVSIAVLGLVLFWTTRTSSVVTPPPRNEAREPAATAPPMVRTEDRRRPAGGADDPGAADAIRSTDAPVVDAQADADPADVTGTIVDVRGSAVEGAWIEIQDEEAAKPPVHVLSDSNGRFGARIARDGPHRITARADDVGAGEAGPLYLTRGLRTEVGQVVLRGPQRIDGFVRFADGTPVAFVQVHLRAREESISGSGLRSASTITNPAGAFSIGGLADAVYSIGIGGLSRDCISPHEVTPANERLLEVEVTGYELEVSALYDGDVLSQASVALMTRDSPVRVLGTRSRALRGTYRFQLCEPGTFWVVVDHPEHGKARAEAVLEPPAHVSRLQIDLADSPPKGTVRCVLETAANGGRPSGLLVLRDAYDNVDEGMLAVHRATEIDVPVGKYWVDWRPIMATYPQHSLPARAIEHIEVREGRTTEVCLRPAIGGSLRMQVRCVPGCVAPATGTIETSTGERRRLSWVVTEDDGVTVSASLRPNVDITIGGALPEGVCVVTVEHHGRTRSTEVSIAAGTETFSEVFFDGE